MKLFQVETTWIDLENDQFLGWNDFENKPTFKLEWFEKWITMEV